MTSLFWRAFLTGLSDPVTFDLFGDGKRLTIGWTARDEDDAFLVLDRNGNGRIDNGTEMFGNVTPQPLSQNRNGFLALAEYDKPVNGGNGDGQIDSRDAIFSALRLWQDANHNGVTEATELHPLSESGIAVLNLAYHKSRRIDMYGNQFKFRAAVRGTNGSHTAPWAWDVFFVYAL